MNSINEVQKFFNESIAPNMDGSHEKVLLSKKLNKYLLWAILILFISMLFKYTPLVYLSLSFIFVFLFIKFIEKKPEESKYKQNFLSPILKNMDTRYKFKRHGSIDYQFFRASGFIGIRSYKYKSSSLLTFEDKNFTIQYANTDIFIRNDEGEREHVFKGLFAYSRLNMNLKGRTILLPDFAEKKFGFVGQGMQFDSLSSTLKKVRLDSNLFEKEFVVYSTDIVEAHYILTHTVMEGLTNLFKKYNTKLFLSFSDDYIYILGFNGGVFNSKTYASSVKFEAIKRDFELIFLVRDIVEEFYHHHLLEHKNKSI